VIQGAVALGVITAALQAQQPAAHAGKSAGAAVYAGAPPARRGELLYMAACAACHGADARGAPQALVGFDVPLPDFTDCNFATREPDADWAAVVHQGGPVRGFDRMMPAFGAALTDEEIQWTLEHLRTLCGDEWPRGELNLPRALVTEKAYPEDEAVLTTAVAVEGPGAVTNELVYEKRFGARNQWELSVPFGFREGEAGGWRGGIGDIAFAIKRALFHSLASGTILSASAELILPTGDEDDGFGTGTTVFEPFIALGQLLPAEAFFQFQGGVAVPFDTERVQEEAFWRAVLGKSITEGRRGRVWSPMVELLGARELESGATTLWDLVPQFQVTLNTRQHIMANAGVRIPLNDTAGRQTEFLVYLLWDWFDGGLFDGW